MNEKSVIEYTEDFRKQVERLQELLVKKYGLDLMEAHDLHVELMNAIKKETIQVELDMLDLCRAFPFLESVKGFEYWNHIISRYFYNEMKKAHE